VCESAHSTASLFPQQPLVKKQQWRHPLEGDAINVRAEHPNQEVARASVGSGAGARN